MFGRKKNETPGPAGFEGRLVGWRRHIHAHPELCFEEVRTADLVAAKLTDAVRPGDTIIVRERFF